MPLFYNFIKFFDPFYLYCPKYMRREYNIFPTFLVPTFVKERTITIKQYFMFTLDVRYALYTKRIVKSLW